MSLPEFYQRYADLFEGDTIVRGLITSGDEALDLYKSIGPGLYDYSYAEGKWTVRELMGHIIDAERVFSYRALRFARGDGAQLEGFEQDDWIPEMNIERRTMNFLISEFANLRASTIDLFSSFDDDMLSREGIASGTTISVEQLGKIIVGHEAHHRKIIKERYLNS